MAILGIPFDNVTLIEALQRIESMIASRRPHQVVTANVDFLIQSRRDSELRQILLNADMVLCDGTPVVWASHMLGNALPERVAGADLVPQLIRIAAQRGYRLYFLGGSPESNEQAIANIQQQYPEITIAGHYSPPFRPLEEMDDADISERIQAAQPDLLFVSFGCPKAEKWIARNFRSLGVPVTIGVGATIDFLAGRVKRAPRWMQRSGTEWLFRLGQEPRRLFRRYFEDFRHFGWELMKQWYFAGDFIPVLPKADHYVVTSDLTSQHVRAPKRLDFQVIRNSEWLEQQAGDRHCLMDLTELEFIDSTGIAFLLHLQRRLYAIERHLILVSPSRKIQRALNQMRVWNAFITSQSLNEAQTLLRLPVPIERAPARNASCTAAAISP